MKLSISQVAGFEYASFIKDLIYDRKYWKKATILCTELKLEMYTDN